MVIDTSIFLFKMLMLGWFVFFFFFFFFCVCVNFFGLFGFFFKVVHSHLDSVEKLDTVVVEWKGVMSRTDWHNIRTACSSST
jgi:hypothetical protein